MHFEELGLIDYQEARAIQESAEGEVVFLCEHPPTITLGRRAVRNESLLAESDEVKLFEVKRGGEATVHSPGQLVVYPVIGFKERRLKVTELVCILLRSVQEALRAVGLEVEISTNPAGLFAQGRKLGYLGLELKRGVTNHGLSVNVYNDLRFFDLIVPCGQRGQRQSSVSLELGKKVEISEITPHLIRSINRLL
jgi:lipoate-protein ligase B